MSKQVNRWRASENERYYSTWIDDNGVDNEFNELGYAADDARFNSGNYWRTADQEREYARECKKIAMALHEKFGE